MSKDVKISVKPKLLQALYGDVTVVLEKKLNAMAHAEVETKPEISAEPQFKPRKKAISIRMDVDVLDWFKTQPGKYQKMINQACRDYMKAHQENHKISEEV